MTMLSAAAHARGNGRPPDDKAEAEASEHVRKAAEAFRAGRFDEAMTEFEAGYAIVPRPAFVLNMGHVQRQAGNLARARDLYQRYLTAEPGSPQRAEVEGVIAEIDKQLAEQARARAAKSADGQGASSPAPPQRRTATLALGEDPEVPSDIKVTAHEPIKRQSQDEGTPFYREWWFWGTTAGVIAAGVVAFIVIRSSGDDYTTSGSLGTLGR
jgi:tetratricopeptide (TPR) repeat protein